MGLFKTSRKTRVSHRGNRKRTLRPESLQKREMMAGDSVDLDFDPFTGIAHITGTDEADVVEVSVDNRGTADVTDDLLKITRNTGGEQHPWMGVRMYNPNGSPLVESIKFEGFDGDDVFRNRTRVDSVAYGGRGDDMLSGGSGVDTFFGEIGRDRLFGNHGNDVLDGGRDDDLLVGRWGDDTLQGGSGHDSLYAGWGDDIVRGGSGNDIMYGDRGKDEMFGDSGNDKIHGGLNNDVILGGSGNDTINGNGGNDTLMGEAGKDIIQGNDGRDFIYGGSGDDSLYGNTGNDLVVGGNGSDIVSGMQGNDRLYGGDMTGLNLNYEDYGNPTLHDKGDAQDWDKDHLAGGTGRDWFGIADNGLFSDDKVYDRESGETVRDLDPWGTNAGTGKVYFVGSYGHHRDE